MDTAHGLHLHVLYRLAVYVFLSHSRDAQANIAHRAGEWMPRRQQFPCSLRFVPELR